MITAQNICKRYGNVEAVRDVSFSVETEQVLGFLGPNGAGKTTIMKILTGYHFPTQGGVFIDGVSALDNPSEAKKRIGYLPENAPVYGELTVYEYLSFIAEARLIPKAKRKNAVESAASLCGLEQVMSKRIETLSKGFRQRAALAQAIIHDPSILILDEPTTGLDPNQIIEIRGLIKKLGEKKTVILSTHILQEVDAVCSRVLIINEGRIAAQGTPEEIADGFKGADAWDMTLKASDEEALREKFARLGVKVDFLEKIEKIEKIEKKDGGGVFNAAFSVPSGIDMDGERVFDWAVEEGLKILSMSRKRISLEAVFVKITESQTANGGKNESVD